MICSKCKWSDSELGLERYLKKSCCPKCGFPIKTPTSKEKRTTELASFIYDLITMV